MPRALLKNGGGDPNTSTTTKQEIRQEPGFLKSKTNKKQIWIYPTIANILHYVYKYICMCMYVYIFMDMDMEMTWKRIWKSYGYGYGNYMYVDMGIEMIWIWTWK